jgi:hypothetical protein
MSLSFALNVRKALTEKLKPNWGINISIQNSVCLENILFCNFRIFLRFLPKPTFFLKNIPTDGNYIFVDNATYDGCVGTNLENYFTISDSARLKYLSMTTQDVNYYYNMQKSGAHTNSNQLLGLEAINEYFGEMKSDDQLPHIALLIEGADGVGKTSAIEYVDSVLKSKGFHVW